MTRSGIRNIVRRVPRPRMEYATQVRAFVAQSCLTIECWWCHRELPVGSAAYEWVHDSTLGTNVPGCHDCVIVLPFQVGNSG